MKDKETTHFDTGAVRQATGGKGRFDLISPIALRRLAQTCEEGSVKYSDHNWEKGMPFSVLLNHVLIHINDYLAGKTDSEDHLAHAAWGLFAAMHFEEVMPEMNDLRQKTELSDMQFKRNKNKVVIICL